MTTSWQTIAPDRTPQRPPKILPVETAVRPRWSVMVPVYNAGPHLQETLESVLIQALPESEMQIEVVDDCSTDIDVQELVRRVGQGRIGYYRQPYNVGSLRNFETCLNMAKGHFVHLLHSDDLIHLGYYEQLGDIFDTYTEIGAAFCRYRYIDDEGRVLFYPDAEAPVVCVLENWLTRLAERQRIQYVSIVVKRSVYEELGGFYGVHYGEDWEMWARIATRYKFGYTPTVLASYRRHSNSISGNAITTGQNIRDLAFVMDKIGEYLPPDQKAHALREARKFYSHYALRTASMLWNNFKDSKGARAQIKEAWKMHRDPLLVWEIFKVSTKMLFKL